MLMHDCLNWVFTDVSIECKLQFCAHLGDGMPLDLFSAFQAASGSKTTLERLKKKLSVFVERNAYRAKRPLGYASFYKWYDAISSGKCSEPQLLAFLCEMEGFNARLILSSGIAHYETRAFSEGKSNILTFVCVKMNGVFLYVALSNQAAYPTAEREFVCMSGLSWFYRFQEDLVYSYHPRGQVMHVDEVEKDSQIQECSE